jgi:hypothetical protein
VDRQEEAQVQVETAEGTTENLSSSVRKEPILAPALGMSAGLRRRAGAAASVVQIGPNRRGPAQRRRSARRCRR